TRVVLVDASPQDPCREIRRSDERAFELRDRVEERSLPALAGIDAVPGHREPAERILVDRLNLAAKTRKRSSAERAQHTRVDPLGARLPRAELSFHDRSRRGKPTQRLDDRSLREAETAGRITGNERSVGARVSPQQ